MSDLPSLEEIEQAAELIYEVMQPSSQFAWPLLAARAGFPIWVKHENHNPTGAFKVRGGLIHIARLKQSHKDLVGVVTATRGNHGQSIAFAAARHGLSATVVVPEGNSSDKNAAMRALGAELVVYGSDFSEAADYSREVATDRGLHLLASFHQDLVLGVATYSLEFLRAADPLDRVYVPIGLGSGAAGMIAARDALNLKTEVIGVVSSHANTYQLSFEAGSPVPTNSANTLADGLAVRVPNAQALAILMEGLARIVSVNDDEVLEAIGHYFEDTHNVAEGAGAAALAAAIKERDNHDKTVGVVLSGGNINRSLFQQALASRS